MEQEQRGRPPTDEYTSWHLGSMKSAGAVESALLHLLKRFSVAWHLSCLTSGIKRSDLKLISTSNC